MKSDNFTLEVTVEEQDRSLEYLFETLDFIQEEVESTFGKLSTLINSEHYLTDAELAKILKLSRRTLFEYRIDGVLPYYLISGKVLYKESDILKLLEKNYIKAYRSHIE